MEVWLEKWKERYMDKIREVLSDKIPLGQNKEKFQNNFVDDDNDDDNDDEDDDNDVDGNSDNGCEVGKGDSLINKRKEYASTLEDDTSKKKQKFTIATCNMKMGIFGMNVQNCGQMEI